MDAPAATRDAGDRPRRTGCDGLAGHDSILETHGPAKVAKFACLIVIGFRLNPV